jgi:hypothetical protein
MTPPFVAPAAGELPDKVPLTPFLGGGFISERREPPRPLFRTPTPAEPYPVEVMGPLAEPTKAIIEVTQAPAGICANAVLAAAALATQGLADVRLPGTGRPHPVSLYVLSIAESGERKTSADREATQGVRNRERELREIAVEQDRHYRNAADAHEAARKAALKKGKGDVAAIRAALDALGGPPAKPAVPILLVTEPTVEGLVKLLADSHPTIGLFSSEGGSFIGGHAMSDEARIRSAARLSSLWDGEPIDRVRSGDGVSVIVGKRLSLHLMAQPGIAAGFLSDDTLRDQGLLSRFLISAPAGTAGTRLFRAPKFDALRSIETFGNRIRDLLAATPPSNGDGRLRSILIEDMARELFVKFHDAVEVELRPGGKLAVIKGFAAKLAEHAARIAAVIALFAEHTCTSVSAEAMAAGIDLANHYAAEALRLTEDARVGEPLRQAETLRRWLSKRGTGVIWPAEVYQFGPSALRTKADAMKAIGILEDHGHLMPIRADGNQPVVIDGVSRKEAWQVLGENGDPIAGGNEV